MSLTHKEIQISNEIKQSISKQGINQKLMAEAINITPQLLSHISTGRRTATLRNVISIGDYLSDSDFDFRVSNTLFGTPEPLQRQRRDNHPLSKMVGQDREEKQRIDIEEAFDIWDILPIEPKFISEEELSHLNEWLYELIDEIGAELSVFISVCDRYGFDSRSIVKKAQHRERND